MTLGILKPHGGQAPGALQVGRNPLLSRHSVMVLHQVRPLQLKLDCEWDEGRKLASDKGMQGERKF